MSSSITLQPDERNRLLDHYRRDDDPAVRLRAHVILLLADGWTWALITAALYCSPRTIDRWQKRFQQDRIPALFGGPRGAPHRFGTRWVTVLVDWVTRCSPRDFGFLRSRWCCAVLVLLLGRVHHLAVSRETVRRLLHQGQIVWRRPRPILGRADPENVVILHQLRALLRDLPADEVAVFQDEVDINTNPKIGCMWMLQGEQATVVTPGDNEKRYLAGSQNWRTGGLIMTEGNPRQGRNADLFLEHLDDLRRSLRCYRVIHVICDHAKAHDCRKVEAYLAHWGDRVKIHYLPKYAPECNPIERVWWHLHEEITRNHRCPDMEDLLDLVFAWLYDRAPFAIEGSVYPKPQKA